MKILKPILLFLILIKMAYLPVSAQEKIELYPNRVPNSISGVEVGENFTQFYAYIPEKQSSKKAFLIIPGGGYAVVAMKHEGHDVAKRLSDLGYAAFVLRYRLPSAEQHVDKKIAPIQDAQTALAYLKNNVNNMGLDVDQIGVLGFSAGGHLASTLSTHYTVSYLNKDIEWNVLRPDFSVLVYPVITMDDSYTHKGSKINLLGPEFKPEEVIRFSNELNVREDTAPTYLIHAKDDKVVSIENTFLYQKALEDHRIDNGVFIFEKGGHGFGMVNKHEEGDWLAEMLKWLENIEFKK